MTTNQLAYLNLQETIRANQAREGETHRANLASESLRLRDTLESIRHNQKLENISMFNLGETWRSNRARENENQRHNLETESLQSSTIAETNRANLANEAIRNEANKIDRWSAIGNYFINSGKVNEEIRHNQQMEDIGRTTAGTGVANAVTGGLRNVADAAKSIVGIFSLF